MKTLIVRHGRLVTFAVTNYPDYRLRKIQQASPVEVTMFGVTARKAKDIRAKFSHLKTDSDWFQLTDEFEQFLSQIIEGRK